MEGNSVAGKCDVEPVTTRMQTAPRGTLATLTALLLGFGLMQMGNTFQGTLLSIRGGIEGFSPAQIGAVGSGISAWIVIRSLRCRKVIARRGHIRAFVAPCATD